MPDKTFFIEKTSLIAPCSDGGLVIAVAAIMPHARERSKHGGAASARLLRMFSAKRNGGVRKDASTSSLRAQRSNPESFRRDSLDCFAALAMTAFEEAPSRPATLELS
ncbi:hypothetical protein [Bradyrhizobium huanghuaihaiense]|uniref:hypothetical protein n=1 Tax=Bradyrhizobium huanghuaihaiense TaxID=990078 RepID=UPI00131533A8